MDYDGRVMGYNGGSWIMMVDMDYDGGSCIMLADHGL